MGSPKFGQEFDQFVNDLQKKVDQKDKQDFSAYALDLGNHPRHHGPLSPLETTVKHTWRGPCGDAITFYLQIVEDQIRNLSFESDGCITSDMAASQTAMLAIHKTLTEAKALTDGQVIAALGKFPSASFHCATLAITTLHQAIDKYSDMPRTDKLE